MRSFNITRWLAALILIAGALPGLTPPAWAQQVTDLNAVATPIPHPDNLAIYVKGVVPAGQPVPNVTPVRQTIYPYKLIALGKAFFWDMQVGSDGIQSCAACHFKAGIDDRERNTIVPGADGVLQPGVGKNADIAQAAFPFHKLNDPMNRGSGGTLTNDPAVVHDFDDVIGAQGVPTVDFVGVHKGRRDDTGRIRRDASQSLNGRNIRQITGRQAPTTINAVFNLMNFWDGRAHNIFNGVDPFGPLTPDARVHRWNGTAVEDFNMLTPATVLVNSSLASQAVGPVLSDVEMSWKGRTWPAVGRKLFSRKPLAGQTVHPQDSIFGFLGLIDPSGKGLNTTYADLIREVFQEPFWNAPAGNTVTVDGEAYTLMEANASLFWGIALMAYQSTLVSDDSPVDRSMRGDATAMANFSAQLSAVTGIAGLDAQRGKSRFESGATACAVCHGNAETTVATVSNLAVLDPRFGVPLEAKVELMPSHGTLTDNVLRFYDIGFYNIGMRPTGEDRGRGGFAPSGLPLAFSRHRDVTRFPNLDFTVGGTFQLNPLCADVEAAALGLTCPPLAENVPIDEGTTHDTAEPFGADGNLAVNGSFKVPNLRNIELTGPYFHTGGMLTLMQVVEFYTRGGDFNERNEAFIPIDFQDIINNLNDGATPGSNLLERQHIVAFFLALTDERVRQEAAPFDHPQFFYAEGHDNEIIGNPKTTRTLKDVMVEVKATGINGRSVEGIAPLAPSFADPGDTLFHFRPTQ